ncbi:MAG TPA: hypothetical protein VML55_22635, partial [Planctomycetaceae bacterium]|nr:hypothetical protein [Planctomycetaceae bacterium]
MTIRLIGRCAVCVFALAIVAAAGAAGAQLADAPATDAGAEPVRPIAGVLDLDRTVVRLLKQADEYAAAGRPAEAIAIWQKVLDDETGWLVTRDDLTVTTFGGEHYQQFRPVATEVERRLASQPAVATLYRRDLDGAAAAAFRARRHRGPEPLAAVVRRYLVSSVGDEAASLLACYHLDRGEFVQAERLLARVLETHSRSARDRAQLLARLAVAEAGLGDVAAARQRLAELRRLPAANRSPELLAQAARFLQLVDDASADTPHGLSPPRWEQRSGVPPIELVAASPPESHVVRLTEAWSRSIAVSVKERPASTLERAARRGGEPSGGTVVHVEDGSPARSERTNLVDRWIQSSWVPAGNLLVDAGRAYFKGAERLIAVDAASGDVCWLGLRNRYELTWPSQAYGQASASASAGDRARPASPEDIQRFGDGIHHSLSLIDGAVYSLEGPLVDFDS